MFVGISCVPSQNCCITSQNVLLSASTATLVGGGGLLFLYCSQRFSGQTSNCTPVCLAISASTSLGWPSICTLSAGVSFLIVSASSARASTGSSTSSSR